MLSEEKVFTDLFDLKDEAEIGHIRLSREADLVVVAPATADLLAKMAHGLADDLATAVLLATDKRVLAAPAMNVRMWEHAATKRNVARLREDGIDFVGPNEGEMACGEYGPGRMAEPAEIVEAIARLIGTSTPSARRGLPRSKDKLRSSRRAPRAHHLRPDARADRSGALHRQPLVRQAGPCACPRRDSARRRGDAGERPGDAPRSGRRARGEGRDGA